MQDWMQNPGAFNPEQHPVIDKNEDLTDITLLVWCRVDFLCVTFTDADINFTEADQLLGACGLPPQKRSHCS